LIEAGQKKAQQQDLNLVKAIFNLPDQNISSQLAQKVGANVTAVGKFKAATAAESKLFSHVSDKLTPAKRVEFLNKALDEPAFLQKVLDDPDEVLRWAGVDLLSLFKSETGIQAVKATDNSLLAQVQMWQGTSSYPGIDDWEIFEIPAGTKLYGGIPGQSEFYSVETSLIDVNFNKIDYWNKLQVKPHPQLGYRSKVAEYTLNETVKVAVSRTLANQQYGVGGGLQIYVANYQEKLSFIKEINLN
jgi:hypothetical protein